MGAPSRWTRSRKAIASTTALALVAGVPLTMAILYKGFPVTDVELTTRDVWVTNGEQLQAGRLNRQIEELDALVDAATPEFDVVQNGTDVFLSDATTGSLERIDPAFTRLIERVDIPQNSTVVLGGTTIAITSKISGSVWLVDVANELEFDPTADPALRLGKGGQATVSPDGVVYGTSPEKQKLWTINGIGADPTSADLTFSDAYQLSTVGDVPVVLDTEKNVLVRQDNSTVDLGDEIGMKIQQPGKKNDVAIVATGDALLRVPLSGDEVEITRADIETPTVSPDGVSSPVWLDGCAHGAWSTAQQYLLSCDDQPAAPQEIGEPTEGGIVEFRVNKSVIALNNLNNGNVWLVDNEMRLVKNWDEVTPPIEDEQEVGDEKSATESFEDTLAERTEQNRAPTARDDQYGLRAGRTTVLPVLDNDTDPDGDILTITATTPIDPEVGRLDYIDGGRALQFTPVAGTSNASFRYTVDDGREGGVAQAYVTMKVVPTTVNTAPKENRSTSVTVEAGGSISYNVLADWIDPDGDDLILVSASPVGGDEARFTPDGFVTFESVNSELGEKEVRLAVSDGDKTTTGTLLVNVKAKGSLAPIGTPDFAQVFVGENVIISPLENDIAPSGGALSLLSVDEVPSNTTVSPNLESASIAFTSPKVGTYYFKYAVGDSSESTVGLIRVNVIEKPEKRELPIAVKDTAYLRPGEPTSVSVLINDVSPSGDVLAIRSVDTDGTNGSLSVEVLNNTRIRITSSNALTEQTQFTYTISDGVNEATAGVTVVPIAPIVNRQPPVALNDRISVRAGDIVSVPVLDNDFHPDNAQFTVDPELTDVTDVGDGLAFVNGDTVRYQAATKPGNYRVTYKIVDQYGESASARVTFVVTKPDLKSNRPPVPEPQIARVFAGNKVTITLPLTGIDPDGDSVVVTALTEAPTKGVIGTQTESSFVYTANRGDSGTDTFRYEVQDTYGAKAIGLVSIGVIQPPDVSEPPNAVDDAVEIKPGRTASVPVLLNDSDPSGFKLSVDDELPEVEDGIEAKVINNKVVVAAPDEEGSFSIRYGISNGNGGVDTAFVQVNVTKDAKVVYPIATDYYVPVDDVVDKPYVDVDLVDAGLISNPAGLDTDLVITVDGPNADSAIVDQESQTIRVSPSELRTPIAYTVTNEEDELSASAFIIVPPQVSASYSPPPYLRKDFVTPVIDLNGEPEEWDLADILVVPSGRPAIITEESTVVATNSDGTSAYVDNNTIRFAPAEDFRGSASITFRVTDGADKDDINGNQALITMPLTIGDPDFKDEPPGFTTQNVTIESNGESTTIDLRASSTHENPKLIPEFSYDGLSGATSNISAEIRGGELVVSSPFGVQPGSKAELKFSVKYKDFTVPGLVTVTTVSSTKPLPRATADEAKGQRGVPQADRNVIANDYNPFKSDGKPLTLISAKLEKETGATMTSTEDGVISVTPGPNFIGVVSVVYTIGDATKDPERQVQGRYSITVRDVPNKVNAPSAAEGDRRATVTWKAPATNGEPIDQYTVTWSPADGDGAGTAVLSGDASNYTATGLNNGTDYTFRVLAHNVLGNAEVSDQSNSVRPLGQATPPTNLNISSTDSGNGQINMSWSEGGANGGVITDYEWTAWDGGTAAQTATTGGATSAVWNGKVGTTYTFTVRALATGGNSDPSSASAGTTPVPGKPNNVRVVANAWNSVTGSYSAARADGANPTYKWIFTDNNVMHENAPSSYSFTNSVHGNTTYTLTVYVTAGSVSNSQSFTITTPSEPAPEPTEWQMTVNNPPKNSCPEEYNLQSGYYSSSGPSCNAPGGWVTGSFWVQCKKPGADWYVFRDGNREYSARMVTKGEYFSGDKGAVPNC